VNASLIMNATFDPDPLVKDVDWDGLEDAWEMVYLDTRGIDFRGMDSDSDGVEDLLDVDSDNDHRTDGGDVRLFYFPTYEGDQYDYPLVQRGVRSHEGTGQSFGNRFPEFGINQSSPLLGDIGMTDPEDSDTDSDTLMDGLEDRIHGSDPLLSDTDADGLDDAMEVEMWFTYDNVSIDKRFFDDDDQAYLNLSSYYEAHYKATIYADVRTNVDTEPDISDSIVIEIVETDEWMSRLVELEYTTFYDASGLDDDFTYISVLFNFSFDTLVEDSPWIRISPNPDVFPPTLSDLEVYLDYAIVKILGSDVASGDTDGDGLSDYTELQMGTSISKVDTDSDRITDNAEKIFWFGPIGIPSYEQAVKLRTPDVDNDGLLDGFEVLHDTDPENADEDNDELLDMEEVLNYVTMWKYELTETLVDYGTLSHEFAVSAKGDFLIKLTINNTVNRSIAYYDEDLIYDHDYMDEMNTWFMNNSSTVKYCHRTDPMAEYCKVATYDSDAIILNVTRFGNYVNTTELRKVYIFRNVTKNPTGSMGMDIHKIVYELNVVEPQALVVANFTEFYAGRRGVNPFNPDFDGDGVMDGLEAEVGANPFWLHSDLDLLNDYDEYYGTYGVRTNLTDVDTDDDGVWDGNDIGGGGPTMPTHWGEVTRGTNATDPDTDGDGLEDGFELGLPPGAGGTSNPTLWDTDGDSMPDGWEYHHSLNPWVSDGGFDPDDDGLNNSQEYVADTDPHNDDIDDDLLKDGEEIYGVLYRTNVSRGAASIDNYESQEGYKWVFYNSTTHKKYQYNDQSAETWWVISDDDLTQGNPKIYGDIIVWEDNQNGNWDIFYYNISSKSGMSVTDETADQRYPEIYGDIIVWQDFRNSSARWDLWAYNISAETRVRRPILRYMATWWSGSTTGMETRATDIRPRFTCTISRKDSK
jgi:beta propeller repeat protein